MAFDLPAPGHYPYRVNTQLSSVYFAAVYFTGLALISSCGSSTEGTVTGLPDAESGPDLDAGNRAQPDTQTGPPLTSAKARMIYAANRGVSTPWFTPVDSSGPLPTVQLAPRRGAGYGQGQGNVSYPDITPDGQHVIVVFYPMATLASSGTGDSIIYALKLNGDSVASPVKIAAADQLHALDRVYRAGWLAYVDGQHLYAARLDGQDADAPILVTSVPQGKELDGLRWIGETGTLAYTVRSTSSGQDRKAFWNSVTEAGATEAQPLQTGAGQAEWVVDGLPDGRVVAAGPDDRLHAIWPDGSQASVVLTPADQLTSYLGRTANGSHLVVELRVTWKEERELVSVATDGSDADAPRALTAAPTKKLKAVMSRDGSAAAWVGANEAGQFAAFVAPSTGLAPNTDPRISTWSSKALHVTAFDAQHAALVGSRDDGAVLRFGLSHAEPGEPIVLALVEDVVNYSIPWPTLSTDASQVLYDANTPAGFVGWVVPFAGGESVQLKAPWYRDLLSPLGVLYHEYVDEGALFAVDLQGGPPTPLTPWHASLVNNPQLVEGGRFVLYACDTPSPGIYAASTQGAAPPPFEPILVKPAGEPTPWADAWHTRPATAADHLVVFEDQAVWAYALDGSHANGGLKLADGAKKPLALDGAGGRAVFVMGSNVVATPADQATQPSVVWPIPDGAMVTHIAVPPGSNQVLIAASVQGNNTNTLILAALDGSAAPVVVANELPGWFMGLALTSTAGHVFTILSINATAVPHPDLLMAAATGIGSTQATGTPYSLAPNGYMLWGLGPGFDGSLAVQTARAQTSEDGALVLLSGPDGLYAARSDGSQADAPMLLGPATQPLGAWPAPNANRFLLHHEQQVVVATVDPQGGQQAITPELDEPLVTGAWANQGKHIVLLTATDGSYGATGRLSVVAADANEAIPTPLHTAEFPVGHLAAVVPKPGDAAIVGSTVGGDRSLYLVPLDADNDTVPAPITPVDDVGEAFVGFALP